MNYTCHFVLFILREVCAFVLFYLLSSIISFLIFFPLTAKHWFSASSYDWGFSQLLSRKDLEDASKGFLVEDTLIVEAEIMVMSTVK